MLISYYKHPDRLHVFNPCLALDIKNIYNSSSEGPQYMIVYDNWNNGIKYVYVAYGRNYVWIVMASFKLE